ncbi:cobalamin biosynthesis protein CobG [Sphingobium terrigena]|uniref:Cobalamin biosynthesis protein CobG n=1 Tax=Sphingobium terrigena TaxID=2304063 RepID=A0A418YVA5_9SPHN|nr:cobalamin biosynthesis protein CobG [Sphingobium terrigena]RJG56174.1 cobalamin biosynthesis protein CobG [Sphingobium terrigena]
MSSFAVKGWCPDAWHPMAAGDGLIVRVRPMLGRVTRAQMTVLAEAATVHGNGQIDLTSRANLQLRGVREAALSALLTTLVATGLVDPDPVIETRRNLLVAPDWQEGDDTARIARSLIARLGELPELPGKVGFVIDAGEACALFHEGGDFRIERGQHGGLILRADGHATGSVVEQGAEVDALLALTHWFIESGGRGSGRMARHRATLPPFAAGAIPPAHPARPVVPGGHVLGVPFGRMAAEQLLGLGPIDAIRLTPWRMLLIEGRGTPANDGWITDAGDPLLRVDACPGEPDCPQSTVETRAFARRLAPHVTGRLHVSGCAKGCARAAPADVMLTGRDGRLDLATDARAADPPLQSGLTQAALLAHFGAD